MLKNTFRFLSSSHLNEAAANSLAAVVSVLKSLEENQ